MLKATLSAFLLVSSATIGAAQPKQVSIIDFLVDWRDYVGQPIIITGGSVLSARADGAMLWVRGGGVALSPPWAEREDIRFLLNNCNTLDKKPECSVSVGGIVDDRFGDMPRLTSVDFGLPK